MKKFSRRKEDFVCEHCAMEVVGNGYTDHCPRCLFGKHVDVFPGDRAESCGGVLEPIGVQYHTSGCVIQYRCQTCGKEIFNRASNEDSSEALVERARILAERIAKYGKPV